MVRIEDIPAWLTASIAIQRFQMLDRFRALNPDAELPFRFDEWYLAWHGQRSRYPHQVRVFIDEPVREDGRIGLVTVPNTKRRDQLGCRNEPRFRDGYELPVCWVRGHLSGIDALRLLAISSSVRLDCRETLAFLLFVHIVSFDYHRVAVAERIQSCLQGRTWTELGIDDNKRYHHFRKDMATPLLKPVKQLFVGWEAIHKVFIEDPEQEDPNEPAAFSFLTIPPTRLSAEQKERRAGDINYCVAVTDVERRVLSKCEYHQVLKDRTQYDIFIDGMTYKASRRTSEGDTRTTTLTSYEMGILADYIQANRPMHPQRTTTGVNIPETASAIRLFERARKKVDERLGRTKWRSFRTHPNPTDPKQKTYEFAPPEDLKYCLILPFES